MRLPDNVSSSYIWMNGKVIPWTDANIHIITHGLHYASCVFEGERVYNGQIFKSQQHTQRLHHSANLIDMEMPYSVADIEAAKHDLLEKNGLTNAYIRVFAWRDGEVMGISAKGATTSVAITMWEWPSYFPPELRETGISLQTSHWRKPSPETAPSHSKAAALYAIGTMAKDKAGANGYHDALMLDYRGYVAEASGANIFMVKDGELYTPTPDCFLNGITRQTIIELAPQNGITVHEKHIMPDELMQADEIFVTGTAAEVTAVGKIDDKNFTVGPVTRKLRDAYTDLVNGNERVYSVGL